VYASGCRMKILLHVYLAHAKFRIKVPLGNIIL
jgi:hypothetical protein